MLFQSPRCAAAADGRASSVHSAANGIEERRIATSVSACAPVAAPGAVAPTAVAVARAGMPAQLMSGTSRGIDAAAPSASVERAA